MPASLAATSINARRRWVSASQSRRQVWPTDSRPTSAITALVASLSLNAIISRSVSTSGSSVTDGIKDSAPQPPTRSGPMGTGSNNLKSPMATCSRALIRIGTLMVLAAGTTRPPSTSTIRPPAPTTTTLSSPGAAATRARISLRSPTDTSDMPSEYAARPRPGPPALWSIPQAEPSRILRPERVTMADVSSRRYVIVPVTTLWSSPTSPRDVDAAAVAPHPDVVAWLADLDAAAARLGLHGRALTQLELGEPVEIIDDPDNGWLQVVAPIQPSTLDPRGYPGWLPAAHVSAQVPGATTTLEGVRAGRDRRAAGDLCADVGGGQPPRVPSRIESAGLDRRDHLEPPVVGIVDDLHRLTELKLGERSAMETESRSGGIEVGQPGDDIGMGGHGRRIHVAGRRRAGPERGDGNDDIPSAAHARHRHTLGPQCVGWTQPAGWTQSAGGRRVGVRHTRLSCRTCRWDCAARSGLWRQPLRAS